MFFDRLKRARRTAAAHADVERRDPPLWQRRGAWKTILPLVAIMSLVPMSALADPAAAGEEQTESAAQNWRRTAHGWERIPPPIAPRPGYVTALHPALLGLFMGQLAILALLALPQRRE